MLQSSVGRLPIRRPALQLLTRSMTASSDAASTSDLPVIAIVGTTGVGKSKLGIEIAKHLAQGSKEQQQQQLGSSPAPFTLPASARSTPFAPGSSVSRWTSGEVINADSMQIFRGLDVITNKVTEEEAEGVKHRLIGVVDPRGEKGWGMKRWVEVTLAEVRAGCLQIPGDEGGTVADPLSFIIRLD